MIPEYGQPLSNRELQIASLLALGLTKKEVAAKIHRAENTIVNHARAIYAKLGLRNAQELTLWWIAKTYRLAINIDMLRNEMISSALMLLVMFSVFNNENYERAFRRGRRREFEMECVESDDNN